MYYKTIRPLPAELPAGLLEVSILGVHPHSGEKLAIRQIPQENGGKWRS
jgi:hypothetical protein